MSLKEYCLESTLGAVGLTLYEKLSSEVNMETSYECGYATSVTKILCQGSTARGHNDVIGVNETDEKQITLLLSQQP